MTASIKIKAGQAQIIAKLVRNHHQSLKLNPMVVAKIQTLQ
jgi:hypothetical protein